MRLLITTLLLLMFLVPADSRAESLSDVRLGDAISAELLLSYCERTEPSFGGFCAGYILSVSDTVLSFQIGKLLQATYCPPPEKSIGQMVQVVLRYIDSKPDMRDLPAAVAVAVALRTTAPCK